MNPNDQRQRDQLAANVEWSYDQMDPFRKLTRGLVEEYAGAGYGRSDQPKFDQVINLMNQAAVAATMTLAANRPRVLLSTEYSQYTYFAKKFTLSINNLIKEIRLESSLRMFVLDAFFCAGFMRVFQKDSIPVMLEQDMWIDPGNPWASSVSVDNIFFDYRATRWGEIRYAGDMYRIPFEDIERGDRYEFQATQGLRPNSKYDYVDEGRLERISKGDLTDHDEFEPHIDVADVWIRKTNQILTYAVQLKAGKLNLMGKPIAVNPYNGPEGGPYDMLGFNPVPQNVMPTSPAQHVAYMSRLINSLLRKQSKRARNQKRINTYTPAGAQSADNIAKANDGDFRVVEDPTQIGEVNIGGVDPQTQAFVGGLVQLFDRMSGNLSAKMGLGPQSGTVGQDRMINEQVSSMDSLMQLRVQEATTSVITKLGHMLWHDDAKRIPGRLPIEGAEGYFVDASWTPEDREGNFIDYDFDIDVYSMMYTSPQQRVSAINGLLKEIYLPLADQLAAQGGQVNLQQLTDIHADLLSLPRLRQVIQFANIPPEDRPGPQGTGKPSETTRRYVRTSDSNGGGYAGRQAAEQQMWLGAANSDNAAMATQLG